MRSPARLAAAIAALAASPSAAQRPPDRSLSPIVSAPLPPEAGTPEGPSGTAGAGVSAGYDAVGYAALDDDGASEETSASAAPDDGAAITAAHRTIPPGSYAEVTALDTGRTILVLVAGSGLRRADREIDLSRGAVRALGLTARPSAPVRVRSVGATPGEAAALRTGQPVTRLDAPEIILRALRRQLSASAAPAASSSVVRRPALAATPRPVRRPIVTTSAVTPPVRTATPRPARPIPVATPRAAPIEAGRFLVQVAAFSTEPRAVAVARSLGGRVFPAGAVWRVRLGPFADMASAQRARDGAARRGYGDASILLAD